MSSDSRPFSRRFGYNAPQEAEITLREDAPAGLRHAVVMLADRLGIAPTSMRFEVCGILLTQPDPSNYSEYPNVFGEVMWLVEGCAWYKVYDIAEGFYRLLSRHPDKQADFEDSLNEYFIENGIGWEMKDGNIVARASEPFAKLPEEAIEVLDATARATAAKEIHEALRDISRRPEADTTGAIQHAMAALECVARDITGEPSATLGQLISKLDLPKPLDQGVTKLWGYASETGRHLREGRDPSFEEAELVVSVASSVCVYLAKKAGEEPQQVA